MEVHESIAIFSQELVSKEAEQPHFPTGRTKLLANLPVRPPPPFFFAYAKSLTNLPSALSLLLFTFVQPERKMLPVSCSPLWQLSEMKCHISLVTSLTHDGTAGSWKEIPG